MPLVVVVTIPVDITVLDEFGAKYPEFDESIGEPNTRLGMSHQRLSRAGEVVEIEQFADRETFDAFMDEVKPALDRFEQLLGVTMDMRFYDTVD